MNNAPQPISPEEESVPNTTSVEGESFSAETANPEADTSEGISSLAPKILTDPEDLKRIKPYLEILKKTIDTTGISNIALTGGYGSGKSTIINTFQHGHSEYSYLRISLASFGDVKKDLSDTIEESPKPIKGEKKTLDRPGQSSKTVREKNEELERLLEISILQQIFYHVKPSAIPDSRFKRITNITDNMIRGIAVSLILWITSIFILFKFNYINRINPKSWDWNLTFDWFALLIFFIFFTGIGFLTKSIIRLLGNSKISKVNIKGELELGDKLDKSVFNEYLEEILYFFERTSFNLVIIEDLDRFESTEIFTKLRELNTLLNNSLAIKERKNHKEIVFLYAIRDEMFSDKNERVKFFEYIIPVIPFINPSNAGEQLSKLISGAKLQNILSKDFTEDVVTFIDDIDMRLLTNIFHEYQIYRQSLAEILQQDNLFAIITYKNMFPDDFGKLHSRKGKLHHFLSGRDRYTKKLINEIDLKIEEKQEQIENIEASKLNNINELRAVYIHALHTKIPKATAIKVGTKKLFSELSSDDNFEELSNLDNIEYYYYVVQNNYSSYTLDIEQVGNAKLSFASLEQFVNPEFTYTEREQMLMDAAENKVEELKLDIDKLKAKLLEIESWSLKEIFEHVEINLFLEDFPDNGLIRNLLLNGYIDENYNDYISLFHAVNMSSEDFIFERKVKSGVLSPIDFKLTHTAHLIKKLGEKYFRREVVLNLDLVDCLVSDTNQSPIKRKAIFALLSEGRERSMAFVDEFVVNRTEHLDKFIQELTVSSKGLWNFLEKKSGYPIEKMDRYLYLLTAHSGIDALKNQGAGLASYISKKTDFLSLFKTEKDQGKAKEVIKLLGISFSKLTAPNDQTANLFKFVYDNSYYDLNIDNVLLILQQNGVPDEYSKTANYTAIQASECKALKTYIENSIDVYVKSVLLKLQENVSEKEEEMVKLLNHDKLMDKLKRELIEYGLVYISDLSKIKDLGIRQHLLDFNRVQPLWENIFIYFDGLKTDEGHEFDDTMIGYLDVEENYIALSGEKIRESAKRSSEFINSIAIKLMQEETLDYEAYIALMESHGYSYNSIDFEGLSEDKVEWLIDNKRLTLTKFNYDMLKETFPDFHVNLLVIHQDQFKSKIGEFEIDDNDTVNLLESSVFSDDNKLMLYQNTADEVIIANSDIGKFFCKLLSNHAGMELSYEVAQSFFSHSPSFEHRIELLNLYIGNFSNAQVQALVEALGGDYREIFQKRHKPKFRNEGYHRDLFSKLKTRGMITNFGSLEKDENILKVYANY